FAELRRGLAPELVSRRLELSDVRLELFVFLEQGGLRLRRSPSLSVVRVAAGGGLSPVAQDRGRVVQPVMPLEERLYGGQVVDDLEQLSAGLAVDPVELLAPQDVAERFAVLPTHWIVRICDPHGLGARRLESEHDQLPVRPVPLGARADPGQRGAAFFV